MNTPLEGKRIILGVTGSIAAYKAVDLASKLSQAGAEVDVILTRSAIEFVKPITFQSVTGRRTYTEADLWGKEGHVLHIGLGKAADLLIIAPATANTLAKLAHGLADNLLTVTALAIDCPLMLAPAMDGGMYSHAATQANLKILEQRGAIVVGPAEGHLASGQKGIGRMVEPEAIMGHARKQLSRGGLLENYNVLITAGGTQEPIDPVRVITNRSSGKQGYALAQAAQDLGADVTLVSAPVNLKPPVGAELVEVRTARQMLDTILAQLSNVDVLVMAAAVTDFTPEVTAAAKIKKEQGIPVIHLKQTADILSEVAIYRRKEGRPKIVVGFAAETSELLENARKKLDSKQLDLIAANDISTSEAGFEVDTNLITLIDRAGHIETLPLMSKAEAARAIMKRVVQLLTIDV